MLGPHDSEVKEMQKRLVKGLTPSSQKYESNTTRKANYPQIGKVLGASKLNRILEIDADKRIAIVEPGVSMEKLAKATLEMGLIPPVIPEFKGITVGGAINGAALESSSHQYGQFNDTCLSYEVLLGDGSIVKASPSENSDLFFGMSGSYGSLGILTKAEIKLLPAKPWVVLSYHRFDSISAGIEFMKSRSDYNFIEGIVFAKNKITVILGNMADDTEVPEWKEYLPWSQFYYQHVDETKNGREKMRLYDYLFRHDRGAFWIGSYMACPGLLARYYLESRWGFNSYSELLLGQLRFEDYNHLKAPGVLFRSLARSGMGSRSLYKMLHAGSENWFADRLIVQDYYLPAENAGFFVEKAIEEAGVFPVWLCPVKAGEGGQLFSPHHVSNGDEMFFDVGIYGMPSRTMSLKDLNRKFEGLTTSLGGRKMLYSYNYYTEDEFWKVYPRGEYLALREKYKGHLFPSIEEKVL